MSYLHKSMRLEESKIKTALPNHIIIVIDGWSYGPKHFVGVFATFQSSNVAGYDQALLAIYPLENKDSQDAPEHVEFLEFVLQLYGTEQESLKS